jgi:hypothetical protein
VHADLTRAILIDPPLNPMRLGRKPKRPIDSPWNISSAAGMLLGLPQGEAAQGQDSARTAEEILHLAALRRTREATGQWCRGQDYDTQYS